MAKVFNLKMFRKSLGLNQVSFAQEMGFAQGYISELEAGKKAVSEEFISKLRTRFGKERVDVWITNTPEVAPTVQQDVDGDVNYFTGTGEVSVKEGVPFETLNKALDEISEQRKLVTKAQEQIDRLLTLLERK